MLNCGNETVQRITEMYGIMVTIRDQWKLQWQDRWKIDEEIMHDEYYR